jgi:phage-related holin
MAKSLPIPDTYTFAIAALIGLGIGALLSFLFGRLTLPTRIPSEFTVAGYSSGVILTNIVLIAIVSAIVFFAYVSFIVQDVAFPMAHPGLFILETIIVGFVPASVIYVITDFRAKGYPDVSSLNQNFFLLAGKFAIFHLLFQFSGVYSYLLQN